ncbi:MULTISPECIES: hypothetical protein [Devosiaceae]|uniref:Uncharacterized protein n=1 Tax=Devosia ginsengisoli TaxID=400770 RepID=A0A5B8LXM7_9HYPH|nr:hypothetical protein [Devosia ginsengisoli]QDZ12561.1 hypothetical protein FPZ08_18515 [Devosia ginsengisoli]
MKRFTSKALDPEDPRLDSLFVARYRDTDDRENLLAFHDRGLEALGATEIEIQARRLSTEFLTEWSVLLGCHGFVTAAVMARGPDVEAKRAGAAGGQAVSVDAQRVWFSHYFLEHYDRRQGRAATEEAIELLVNQLSRDELGFELDASTRQFFSDMLQPADGPDEKYRVLKNTYRETKLSRPQMRKFALLPTEGIPLLDPKLPLPKVGRS